MFQLVRCSWPSPSWRGWEGGEIWCGFISFGMDRCLHSCCQGHNVLTGIWESNRGRRAIWRNHTMYRNDMRGHRCWLCHLGTTYISYLGIVWRVYVGNSVWRKHSTCAFSQITRACLMCSVACLVSVKRECHNRALVLLCIAVPQDHTDYKRRWAMQCQTRCAGHILHISPMKQSPTANIILPTQSGSDSLIHIMSHMHNCQFCIKRETFAYCLQLYSWREWLLNEMIV